MLVDFMTEFFPVAERAEWAMAREVTASVRSVMDSGFTSKVKWYLATIADGVPHKA